MVKGVSKRVVVVKPQGDIFEEAIFIVRSGAEQHTQDDILREAHRVADLYAQRRGRRRLIPPPLYAALGAVCVAAAWVVTAWVW